MSEAFARSCGSAEEIDRHLARAMPISTPDRLVLWLQERRGAWMFVTTPAVPDATPHYIWSTRSFSETALTTKCPLALL